MSPFKSASSGSSGLDGFKKRIEGAVKAGRHLSPREALTPEFMAANTDSPNLPAFLEAGHFDPGENDAEAFNAMTKSKKFNAYIKAHSQFGSWSEMLSAAIAAWVKRKGEGR
jgi:hypothetical protein